MLSLSGSVLIWTETSKVVIMSNYFMGLVASRHSLSILNLVIILLKNQLLQFPMHSIHNFSLNIYHLKYLKIARNTR